MGAYASMKWGKRPYAKFAIYQQPCSSLPCWMGADTVVSCRSTSCMSTQLLNLSHCAMFWSVFMEWYVTEKKQGVHQINYSSLITTKSLKCVTSSLYLNDMVALMGSSQCLDTGSRKMQCVDHMTIASAMYFSVSAPWEHLKIQAEAFLSLKVPLSRLHVACSRQAASSIANSGISAKCMACKATPENDLCSKRRGHSELMVTVIVWAFGSNMTFFYNS